MCTIFWRQAGEQEQNDRRLLVRERVSQKTAEQYRGLEENSWQPRFLYLAKICQNVKVKRRFFFRKAKDEKVCYQQTYNKKHDKDSLKKEKRKENATK